MSLAYTNDTFDSPMGDLGQGAYLGMVNSQSGPETAYFHSHV